MLLLQRCMAVALCFPMLAGTFRATITLVLQPFPRGDDAVEQKPHRLKPEYNAFDCVKWLAQNCGYTARWNVNPAAVIDVGRIFQAGVPSRNDNRARTPDHHCDFG